MLITPIPAPVLACPRRSARSRLTRTLVAVLAVTAGITTACQTASFADRVERWDSVRRPARAADFPIEIANRDGVGRAFKAIGTVIVTAARWEQGPGEDAILDVMRKGARSIGGDALIDFKHAPTGRRGWAGPGLVAAGTRDYYDEVFSAVVIVYTEPPAAVATP